MNKATQQMKEAARLLIVLIRKVNRLLEIAEKNGVGVELNCGGNLGRRESTEFVVVQKCIGNFLKTAGTFNLVTLENKLRQIEKELKGLTAAGYYVVLDSHNRKTYAFLFLEHICMILYGDEFEESV